jgi:hypothetical protein
MKIYIALILAAALCSACGNKQPSEYSNSQSTASTQSTPAKTQSSQSTAAESTSGAPVEFIYGGITPDKTSISYKIKVNTDKPIEEVHLALKETDAGGKVVEQTMIAWQNIVRSHQQPIEKGKTYEAETPLDPAATKAECSLTEVVFNDGTRWTAKTGLKK